MKTHRDTTWYCVIITSIYAAGDTTIFNAVMSVVWLIFAAIVSRREGEQDGKNPTKP